MADPDLQKVFDQIISWNSIQKIISEAYELLALAIGQAVSNLWLTSRTIIIYLILFFFVRKFYDGGIGSLVYNLIYFLIAAVLIWIFGWKVLFSIWFEFIYPFSYITTGFLLRKIGVWK
ncbi:MAG: hypothetical protein WC441_01915 [Patescibacteria group bacterium]